MYMAKIDDSIYLIIIYNLTTLFEDNATNIIESKGVILEEKELNTFP